MSHASSAHPAPARPATPAPAAPATRAAAARDAADDQLQLLLHLAADWLNGDRTHAAEIYALATSLSAAGDPVFAPVNTDVPFAQQTGTGDGSSLTCTMGNWDGQPSSYSYQWVQDGSNNIGLNDSTYPVTVDDVGHTMTCVVTATNALGSTASPPSNGVVVG